MLILVIVTLAAISSSRTATLEERMTQASRSRILAFQASEAALSAARKEYRTPNGSSRGFVFDTAEGASADCGDSAYTGGTISAAAAAQRKGLCRDMTSSAAGKLKNMPSSGTAHAEYALNGDGTPVQNFSLTTDAAGTGTASVAAAPRYLTEDVCGIVTTGYDASKTPASSCKNKFIRVTAIGFGSTGNTVAITQEMMEPLKK